MKFETHIFPSVIESTNALLTNVSSTRLEGLKIQHENQDYIVGNLALIEGTSPHKAINCAPDEMDYQLLIKSALLIAERMVNSRPMVVTTGFPYSTFQIFKSAATEFVKSIQNVSQDEKPFGGYDYRNTELKIASVHIIPELIGSILSIRNSMMNIRGGMFVVSLGYGTLEIGLSTDNGIVQRTFGSGNGLRFALDSAMRELSNTHYLGLRNEHQFDESFKTGSIIANRKRLDLTEIRKKVLAQYYRDVISPIIRNTWTDEDFSRVSTLVLVGGGAHYEDLVNQFREEFDGILTVEVPEEPHKMASHGYALHSRNNRGNSEGEPVGIDIGNANTAVTTIVDDFA
ncbi:MAG: ParM/StbA family protein [Balneolaceae bacterium]|nr:MAG: ParM/StbA family protein [Balneolaceae bacterium]